MSLPAAVAPAENRIVTELPTGEMTVDIDSYDMPFNSLLGFAARANPKRGFLFMSKVLGKHYPSKPSVMRRVHSTLAKKIPHDLPQPIVFIAMAETAIGLGNGVFDEYLGIYPNVKALFIHSSRYHVEAAELIEFEESHSHAPRQFLHLPLADEQLALFSRARSLVIIDDEASTGNTFVNLMKACTSINPAIERIHLSVITNFMGEKNSNTHVLTERFGMKTCIAALLSGSYSFSPKDYPFPTQSSQNFLKQKNNGANSRFGRLGLIRSLRPANSFIESLVNKLNENEKILVLGTGEFMHLPYLFAAELENRGFDVYVQSSTRSPILIWGSIKHARAFKDNYRENITNFLYNVMPGQYDKVFVCHETPPNQELIDFANSVNATLLHFKSETEIEENIIC